MLPEQSSTSTSGVMAMPERPSARLPSACGAAGSGASPEGCGSVVAGAAPEPELPPQALRMMAALAAASEEDRKLRREGMVTPVVDHAPLSPIAADEM